MKGGRLDETTDKKEGRKKEKDSHLLPHLSQKITSITRQTGLGCTCFRKPVLESGELRPQAFAFYASLLR
jgi:hypothetical protein